MKKPLILTNRKFGFTRVIGLAAVVLIAAVFISALLNARAQAANVNSFFGLADVFGWKSEVWPSKLPEQIKAVNSLTADDNRSPDAVNNYAPTRTTGITYNSISGTGTSVTGWRNALSTDDNLSVSQPIGFPFIYNGGAYQNFLVSTNGFITFNTGTAAVGGSTAPYNFQNTTFYTSGASCSCLAVAPFYDDLQTASNLGTLADLSASIKYQTTGAVGSRVLTVEWINFQDFATSSNASLNFQAKLYEIDGHVEFAYGTMNVGSGDLDLCGRHQRRVAYCDTNHRRVTDANDGKYGDFQQHAVSNISNRSGNRHTN